MLEHRPVGANLSIGENYTVIVMKICIKCNIEKPFSEFYKAPRNGTGYRGNCKSCAHIMHRERYTRSKNFAGYNQKNLTMPTLERLRELFQYNSDGSLTRLVSRGTQKAGTKTIGKLDPSGYRRICVDSNHYLFHRIVWQWHYGDDPEFVDHINNNRQDNRIENMSRVTKSNNTQHQLLPKNNTSGFFGVSWYKKKSTWKAEISLHGKKKYLGQSQDLKTAVLRYNEACNELHGEFGKKKIQHNVRELKRRGLL